MSDQSIPPVTPEYTGEAVAQRADKGTMLARRWAGAWIDFIAVAFLIFAPALLVGLVVGAGGSASKGGELLVGLLIVFGVLLGLAYYPLTEGVWGRTLGKLATGTMVVDRSGARASFGQVIVRTLMRVIEVNPFLAGGIPAGICVLATKGNQRIGDLAAGTYVVPVTALKAAMASPSVF